MPAWTIPWPHSTINLGDPYFSGVTLLIHGDASPITDFSSSARNISAQGGAAFSTTQSKFGGGSVSFDGTDDALITDTGGDTALSGDFTMEAQIYPTEARKAAIVGQWDSLGNYFTAHLMMDASRQLYFYRFNSGGGSVTTTGTDTLITLNTWNHVAVSRVGSSIKLFVNGTVQTATDTYANPLADSLDRYIVGANKQTFTLTNPFKGFMDEVRIDKATGRYTSGFTPPTAAFPNS